MPIRDVLISGASVAGPALAYWLRRYGFNPTVIERAPALRGGGYAVDFRGPAHLGVLRRMGLLDEIRRQQTHMGEMSYVDAAGRVRARMPADIFSGEVEILRGDLSRILHEATRHDTEYVFGDSVTGLTEESDGVHVTFDRGAPRRFDLVVGADGAHSSTRRLAFGDTSAYAHHLGYYSAVCTTPNHLGLDHTGLLHSVPGRTAGVYSARDNREAKAVFFFASPPLPVDHRDTDRQRQILAEVFAGVGWEVPALVKATWDDPDFYFDAATQIRLDRWSAGRVVLLGDAGYAPGPGGNGTGTAIVGAYLLAGELAAAGGDHRAAFRRYEERLRGYVAGNQKQAAGGTGFLVPETRTRIWLRDQMFRTLPYVPWRGVISKMATRTAAAITLPDYPG